LDDYENYLSTEFEASDDIDFDDNLNKAHSAMLKIPSKAQEIINLRIYEELSYVEIAKIM
jgi:DNA-directed RNA polymerase specialized sigma24 family protein